jgi:hypothetical protein
MINTKNNRFYFFYILPILLITSCNQQPMNRAAMPMLQEQEDSLLKAHKNRAWSAQEAEWHDATFKKVKMSIEEGNMFRKKSSAAFTDVNSLGTWVNRGPYNMPGSFEFCEMDEGTDTVYAVSCGHYGGVQFIWKGTLAGDDWNIINPKDPSRFQDLIVIPNGTKRRVIAAHENGKIMYSDDGGKAWIYSSGISSGIKSTIVNRQDNHVLYATDGKTVYRSTDNGSTFASFFTIGSSSNQARLYSPRWTIQPNATDVYMAIDNKFFKLNAAKTSFDLINSSLPTGGRIGLGGDSRKLWLTVDRKWHYSTNVGTTFNYQLTKEWWYKNSESNDMVPGHYPGVNPENTNIFIGGYAFPLSTRDGGVTQNNDARNHWGEYQNSVGNDPKVRINYHPDMQASQFFYDKTGKLLTLRSTDGGVFKSYNEWTKTSFPDLASIQNGVFYNISLFDEPSQETYRGAFMYGSKDISHLTTGTQDQGWQNVRNVSPVQNMYYWDQVGGGDGPCCITGDGIIGWSYNYQGDKEFARIQLYNGSTYEGLSGTTSAAKDFTFTGGSYFTPSVGDWSDGNRIWVLSQTLRRIEYNTSTQAITAKEHNLANSTLYIQGIAQSHVNSSVLYALHNGMVFKSTDRGTNWNQIASQSSTGMQGADNLPPDNGPNRGMGWSSPNDEKIVLFASQSGTAVNSIFSKDGGVTWANVTGSGANLFPNAEVNGMAGTADGKLVFASTSMGPYVFIINEEKWYPLAIGENIPIFCGQIMYCVKYGTKEIARFSTWGQGIWDFEISTTTTQVQSNVKEELITLYPNPATHQIHVSVSQEIYSRAMLSIDDATGKLVQAQSMNGSKTTLDVSHFPAGVYFISIRNGEQTIRKKFIKE